MASRPRIVKSRQVPRQGHRTATSLRPFRGLSVTPIHSIIRTNLVLRCHGRDEWRKRHEHAARHDIDPDVLENPAVRALHACGRVSGRGHAVYTCDLISISPPYPPHIPPTPHFD